MSFLHNNKIIDGYINNMENQCNDEETLDIIEEYFNKKFDLNELLDIDLKVKSNIL
ncbi:hypothetical protein [Clostridium ihumii]|uniref:hypothetical protein n=1 Tax=Clostridium ihumii TaxID=1470356 RepID=UPI003D33D0EE